MADDEAEEGAFVAEDVTALLKEQVDAVLQNTAYSHQMVPQWTSAVIEKSLAALKDTNKPAKYIVTAAIVQKNGAGLHLASSTYWDSTQDGSAFLRWENKTMYCLITVFSLAL
mgnify:FL=1